MNTWLSIFLMIAVIYSVRMLPMILLRHNITNRFVRSFLYYVPYVTLSVMTFPAIVQATDSIWSGIAALAAESTISFKVRVFDSLAEASFSSFFQAQRMPLELFTVPPALFKSVAAILAEEGRFILMLGHELHN